MTAIKVTTLSVLWEQVLGLMTVQGATTLAWVIYRLYLPDLLAQFGWPRQFAIELLIIESAIAIALEPLMGELSDRSQRWLGTRFPLIGVGVVIASVLLITIPVLAIFTNPVGVMHGAIVVILVLWSMAMTMFHSPAISLLKRYSSVSHLPLAVSLLTLVSGLLRAIKPLVNQFILSFGPAVTFATGSLVLLGATAVLRSVDFPATPGSKSKASPVQPLTRSTLGLIAGVGLSIEWGSQLALNNFNKVFVAQLPGIDPELLKLTIGIGVALMAVPAAMLATRLGNQRMLCAGLLMTAGFSGLMVFLPTPITLAISATVLVISLNLVINGGVAFALSTVPPEKVGLGVGMYFGGTAAGSSLFGMLFNKPEQIPLSLGVLIGAIACLIATLYVAAISKRRTPRTFCF